jgi:hypothetical protein
MWFESWDNLGRTAVSGVVAYTALILFLRLSGKRTLAKLNVFDLVVTVALGSTLSTILLSRQMPLSQGLLVSTTAGLEDRGDGAGAVRQRSAVHDHRPLRFEPVFHAAAAAAESTLRITPCATVLFMMKVWLAGTGTIVSSSWIGVSSTATTPWFTSWPKGLQRPRGPAVPAMMV